MGIGTISPAVSGNALSTTGTLYMIPSAALANPLPSGIAYTGTLVTSAGNSFVSPTFVAS